MPPPAAPGACISLQSFTNVDLTDDTTIVRSNLGGQGGRCVTTPATATSPAVPWSDVCDEQCDIATGECDSPPELYLATVAYMTDSSGTTCVNMRITNLTEYRAWQTTNNGVKLATGATDSGSFGVINLLAPREPTTAPTSMFWNSALTFVEL